MLQQQEDMVSLFCSLPPLLQDSQMALVYQHTHSTICSSAFSFSSKEGFVSLHFDDGG